MNTKHLEFFKNSYYKWLNERPLGIAHVYLFIFQPDIRLFKNFLFCIHCELYNILVHKAIINDFMLFMKSVL